MKLLVSLLDRVGTVLEKIPDYIASILCFATIWFFCYVAVLRYVFRTGYDWGDEVVMVALTSAVLLGAGGATRHDKLTTVDILALKTSGNTRTILFMVLSFVSLVISAVLGWGGVQIVAILKAKGSASTSSLSTPYWIPYLVMPIALFLCSFFFMEKILRGFHNVSHSRQRKEK